jgi:Na+/H+ antiporter NhaC
LAWTLKGTTDALGAKEFVAGLVKGSAAGFMNFMPAIIFVIAAFLAFATGTSWGTFGILIPIVVAAFGGVDYSLMVISISACMAGAVCGDHSSPISDTTIMASAGAECNHVNHVNTQIPYVLIVAAISFVTYIIAGFTRSAVLSLLFGFVLTFGTLVIIKKHTKKEGE